MDTRIAYTIMPEYGCAYAWMKDGIYADSSRLGPNVGMGRGFDGDHPISAELERDFACWQSRFEIEVPPNECSFEAFDWTSFHADGLALAKRLKAELGDAARVFYRKPMVDPAAIRFQEWEIMENGDVKERKVRRETAR
jgi:hypothetical protein